MPGRKANHTDTRQVTAQVKARWALHLRSMNLTYDQIAAAILPCPAHTRLGGRLDCVMCYGPLYTNRGGAKRAVDRALAEQHPDTAAERTLMKQTMTAQLDLLIAAAMRLGAAMLESGQTIPAGMMEAQRNLVRLLDRKAKLWGLDAPSRVVITTELDEQIALAVEQLMDSIAT